jgi:hypothetical protein
MYAFSLKKKIKAFTSLKLISKERICSQTTWIINGIVLIIIVMLDIIT